MDRGKGGIRSICKGFPESYWQKLDQQRTYPKILLIH